MITFFMYYMAVFSLGFIVTGFLYKCYEWTVYYSRKERERD